MEGKHTNTVKLMQGDNQFIIPLFQRRYSWKKPNWERLVVDLSN